MPDRRKACLSMRWESGSVCSLRFGWGVLWLSYRIRLGKALLHPKTDYWGQSSQAGMYLAGDGAGVGGADWSEAQGRLAGLHAAWRLNRTDCKQIDGFSRSGLIQRKIETYLVQYHNVFTPQDGHYRSHPGNRGLSLRRCHGGKL